MSLKITNKLTAKQRDMLMRLEYVGTWDLTVDQATDLIDELIKERNYTYGEIQSIGADYYDFPDHN